MFLDTEKRSQCAKNNKYIGLGAFLLCAVLILCACKSNDNNSSGDVSDLVVKTSQKEDAQDSNDPFEIPKEWAEKIEESKNTQQPDLTLDVSDYEYYNRKWDENPEKYYPTFSTDFDDYTKYSYAGPDEVNDSPRSYDDMRERIETADAKDAKYLYKGRKEDLFTRAGSDSVTMYDSAPYKYIFGYSKPSKEVLLRTLENNTKISEKYKEIFADQICEWYEKYPGLDLTILNENLYTLDVMECTSHEIVNYAVSINALACYRREENTIYVNKESKMDDSFIGILRHEFVHAARTYINNDDGKIRILTSFYTNDYNALFADEALATLFTSYENMAGLYPLIVNCYRIVLDNCDYSFSDYTSHSVYELRDKINYFYGDIAPADDIIKGIEYIGMYIYQPAEKAANSVTLDTVKAVLKNIIKICIKSNPNITVGEVFDMLDRDIGNYSKYSDFLNVDVVTELFMAAKEERVKDEIERLKKALANTKNS